jgi:hypothetical protein
MRPCQRQFLTAFLAALAAVVGPANGGENGDDQWGVEPLTSRLVGLPRRDTKAIEDFVHQLFGHADWPRLVELADSPDLNIAMWARWEMRRLLPERPLDATDRRYPVRLLEEKAIDVPPAWARQFAAQFFPSDRAETKGPGGILVPGRKWRSPEVEALYLRTTKYHEAHPLAPSKVSYVDMAPETYVHHAEAVVPAGTSVRESGSDILIEQAGVRIRLAKPLTKNFYAIYGAFYGENVFLPLVTRTKTFVLYVRGAHVNPFELTCFDTDSGGSKWETVGWSGWPLKVDVAPRNLLAPSFEAILLRTMVGEPRPPDPGNDPGRGGGASGPRLRACAWYLTANDRFVTVFGHEWTLVFVEVFDVSTGRNVLRFATDYRGANAFREQEE